MANEPSNPLGDEFSESAKFGPPPGPDAPPELGPPPDSMPDRREMRRHCFRLIREITSRLGWRYKLWIPAAMLISSVFLLPQRFLQFFVEGSQRLVDVSADRFVVLLLAFGLAIAICLWIAIFLSGVLREWMRLTVSIALRRDAVQGLNKTRIDKLDSGHRGDWMTRMTGDLYSCEEFLTMSLTEQIQSLTMLIGSLILFYFYSGHVTIILIVSGIVLVLFNSFVQHKLSDTLRDARMIEGNVFQSMIETFEGLRTIRSYGGEAFTLRRINLQLKDMFQTGMKIIKSMAALTGLNEFGSQLVITLVLTLVAYRIERNELTAASALVYPFYINLFLGSAKGLAAAAYDWNRFFEEGGRLATLLYEESNLETDREQMYGDLPDQLAQVRKLSVENLVISYGDFPPVIAGFDFSLSRGEIVAIMGPSGCGKSTFLESFSGLRRANAGEFTVTMQDGRAAAYPQAPVAVSAFVEQQPYLFVGTIRDNITMGRSDISDQNVRSALREVCLLDLIESRRGVLDYVLADRGRDLSVGQQYRLALCRALVCDRPFLLMDEPFAALDPESVDAVVEALHAERDSGSGVILITHLMPKSLKADRVVEMSYQAPGRS